MRTGRVFFAAMLLGGLCFGGVAQSASAAQQSVAKPALKKSNQTGVHLAKVVRLSKRIRPSDVYPTGDCALDDVVALYVNTTIGTSIYCYTGQGQAEVNMVDVAAFDSSGVDGWYTNEDYNGYPCTNTNVYGNYEYDELSGSTRVCTIDIVDLTTGLSGR